MNDRVLEADDDTLVSPDDWASLEPKAAPLSASEELQRQVDEFLANGGHIKEFEPGESAIPTHQPLWSFPVGKAAAPDPVLRKKHDDLRLSQVKKRIAGDAKMVEMIHPLLDTAQTLKELYTALDCSSEKLWRVLRDHFPTDKRADRFRKRTREEGVAQREAELVEKIKEAQEAGVRGIWNITKHCNSNYDNVTAVNKKYNLGLVLNKGDNREGRAMPVKPAKRVYQGNAKCENAGCGARIVVQAHYCPHCGTITARGKEKEAEE